MLGGAALLTPPLVYIGERFLSVSSEAAPDASAGRFTNPLRLPGQDGLFPLVRANTLSRLTALPVQFPLRGKHPTALWAYQAELAGRLVLNPILLARPGDRIALAFENRIPQPSIIHWHGFTNDTRNDGGGMTLVEPGGRCHYDWSVRNSAALNWYHPHPHLKAGEQTWRGMNGLFIVEDDESDKLARELGVQFGITDVPLVIQDRTIERSGEMAYSDNPKRQFHGMSGNSVMVNLTRFPVLDLPRRWVRLRILNASNARSYRLALMQKDKRLAFMLLGTDSHLRSPPTEIQEIFLAAAQRIDIAVDLRQADVGDVWLRTLPFDPMHNEMGAMGAMAEMDSMGGGHVHGAQGEGADSLILRINVKPYDGAPGSLSSRITEKKVLTYDNRVKRDFVLDHDGDGTWRINGKSFYPPEVMLKRRSLGDICQTPGSVSLDSASVSLDTSQMPTSRSFVVQNGARETWVIRNDNASMPHPMHLHGFSFSVVERKGSPPQLKSLAIDPQGRTAQDLGRMDTVLVWPGEAVTIEVDFSHPFSGEQSYMFHCHNLEHEDLGMMLAFSIAGKG